MMLLIRKIKLWLPIALVLASACGGPSAPDTETEPGPLASHMTPESAAIITPSQPAPPIPYVVIRFERPGVLFEDTLYTALKRALERHPAAQFDVVLAMPNLMPSANLEESLRRGEQYIENVVLSMTDMGVPAERLRIAASTDANVRSHEIRIFVH